MNRQLLIYTLVCVLLVMGLVGCGGEPGTIAGTVTRASDEQPLANARITIHLLTKLETDEGVDVFAKSVVLQTLITDENGHYSVTLKPIKYMFIVEAPGLESVDNVLEVKSNRTTTVDWALTEPSP